MTSKIIKDVAASVRQRLLNLSQGSGEDFNLSLTRYGLERMLFRLSQSEWRDQFLLKGAMLFVLWHDVPHRPTRDADFLGFVEPEIDEIKNIFRTLCDLDVEDDGIKFDSESVRVEEIREKNAYEGIRVKLTGILDKAKIVLQIDIGFGDIVTPDPIEIEYPTLLDQQAPRLKAYPIYTVIAEKFEAMVKLGMINTRMKDFYDLWILAQRFEFDSEILCNAIKATFSRRKTELPEGIPMAFSKEFFEDNNKNTQWKAFLNKNGIDGGVNLSGICASLENFLMPVVSAIHSGEKMEAMWSPSGSWINNTITLDADNNKK